MWMPAPRRINATHNAKEPRLTNGKIDHQDVHTAVASDITKEDMERVRLLNKVSGSRHAFKQLTLQELKRLQYLVEKKDYSHDKKARKSKTKLLKNINVRIYELEEGRSIWGA